MAKEFEFLQGNVACGCGQSYWIEPGTDPKVIEQFSCPFCGRGATPPAGEIVMWTNPHNSPPPPEKPE
jgi:hypothetical protein